MGKEVCEKCRPFFEEQRRKIEELERRLSVYENAHTPPSQRRQYPKREPTGNPVGAPKGHPGTTRPTPTPDKVIDVKQARCSSCKHLLGKPVRVLKRIIEDIPEPKPIIVTQYNVHAYLCRSCAELNIPAHPDLPQEGRFGYNLQAQVALMKYEDRLPLRKIVATLNRQYNLGLMPATVLAILERVASSCEPVCEQIRKRLADASNVGADETSQKVQGKQWWTWIFTTAREALFLVRKSRGQKPIEEVLGKSYEGVLTCDGWTSYPKVVPRIQRCWAHLLREAKWHAEQYAGQALRLYEELCEIFTKIKQLRHRRLLSWERQAWFRKLQQQMARAIGRANAYQELRKLATKMEHGLEYWFTCVLYPDIEPTNNHAERTLREVVVQRKITGTLRNERGTHILEVLMSVLTTWKLQGLNTFSMLRQTLRS